MLKLRAKDAEDLQVVSAVLQDAIAPVCDMIYRPKEKDFVMVVQRFCREGEASAIVAKENAGFPSRRESLDQHHCFERVRAGVHVTGVEGTQSQGIDFAKLDLMLDLLAVMPDEGHLQFIFAGGGRIRLRLGDWSMILEDFGEPWPTSQCPHHEEGSGVGG